MQYHQTKNIYFGSLFVTINKNPLHTTKNKSTSFIKHKSTSHVNLTNLTTT